MKRRYILDIIFDNWPVKIISLAAAVLVFIFYRINTMEERFFSIPLIVNPPAGLALAERVPNNVRITLRGEADMIFPVVEKDIVVTADFSKINTEGKFRVPLKVFMKGTSADIEPLDIRVEPLDISVYLEHQLEKRLEIKPIVKGNPAHGFELVQNSVTPSVVEVVGPASQVQKLSRLITEEIDLTGRIEDFTVRVRLVHDNPLISLSSGPDVEFLGIIREAEIIKTFEAIDIISIDLSPDLKISTHLAQGMIKLQGVQIAIESLIPSSLRMVIDCGYITEPGNYILYPKPDIPPEFVVLKYEPQELNLTFFSAAEKEDIE